MSFEFVAELEKQVLGKKCVGLRRIVNYKAWHKETKIAEFALGDVAIEHMDTCIELLLKNMKLSELTACLLLETKGFLEVPKMIHYMDKETCHAKCHKALRELLLKRVWPKLLKE